MNHVLSEKIDLYDSCENCEDYFELIIQKLQICNQREKIKLLTFTPHPERVSNIKPFIIKYKWKGLNSPSKTDHWKMFEKNNITTALNSLYNKEVFPCYI